MVFEVEIKEFFFKNLNVRANTVLSLIKFLFKAIAVSPLKIHFKSK